MIRGGAHWNAARADAEMHGEEGGGLLVAAPELLFVLRDVVQKLPERVPPTRATCIAGCVFSGLSLK
jgi:hypothetical protein